MRTLPLLCCLFLLPVMLQAQEEKTFDWVAAARKRLAEEKVTWAKLKPLTGKHAPIRSKEKGALLCPKDQTPLTELRSQPADKKTPANAQLQGLFCSKDHLLYHVGRTEDTKGLVFRGPMRIYHVTRALVLKALQRHTTDSEQQGFYAGRFAKLLAMGKSTSKHLVDIFNQETSKQVRSLAIEALGEVGNREKSITDMLEQVVKDPTAPEYGLTAMVSLAKLGKTEIFDRQVKRLENAGQDLLRENTQRGQAYSNLAGLWSRMNKADKAMACYKKAIELLPQDGTLLYNVACSYSVMKNLDEAFKYLNKAIDSGFNHWEWMRVDGDLKNLHKDPRWKKALARQNKKKNEPR